MSSNKEEAILQFSAKGLDKMDWFGKSDPFLEFSRSTESNKYICYGLPAHLIDPIMP